MQEVILATSMYTPKNTPMDRDNKINDSFIRSHGIYVLNHLPGNISSYLIGQSGRSISASWLIFLFYFLHKQPWNKGKRLWEVWIPQLSSLSTTGTENPGERGLSLQLEQWPALYSGLGLLHQHHECLVTSTRKVVQPGMWTKHYSHFFPPNLYWSLDLES